MDLLWGACTIPFCAKAGPGGRCYLRLCKVWRQEVMIRESLEKLWRKFVNRETVSYVIFGVLTTLVDWISYAVFRRWGMNYRLATVCCQAAAILFAYVTNKIWVFRSYNFHPGYLLKEMASFFSFRILTAVFTYVAMVVMVDGMGISQDMICKIIVSAISLVLNYICSKLFIFR